MAMRKTALCSSQLVVIALLLAIASLGHAFAQSEDIEALQSEASQLYRKGRYSEALPLAHRALTGLEAEYGPGHEKVGTALNSLGLIYWMLGRYADAEPIYGRAISIAEATSGANTWTTGARLNNLAIIFNAQGRYDESEKTYKRALSIAESSFGLDDPEVAKALTNLAAVYWKQGRLTEAETACKRALTIRETKLGPKHPDVSHTLNTLVLITSNQGRYADAEPLAKRALEIEEEAFGPSHSNMVSRLNNLADVYRLEGRTGEAELLYKRALEVARQSGNDDFVRSILNNLGWLYWSEGKLAEAEPLYDEALRVSERVLGPNHPDNLTVLHNLAALYRMQGRMTGAERLLERALVLGEKSGGKHPHVAKALNNLALVYQDQGRHDEAARSFDRAIATAEVALGADHPDTGNYLSNLGALRAAQSNWVAAASLLERGAGIATAWSKRTAGGLGRPQTGAAAVEAARPNERLALLVKVLSRVDAQSGIEPNEIAARKFAAAQRARGSAAAISLSQMAARLAKGDSALALIVRERQDLASQWLSRDRLLTAALSAPPEKRNAAAESELRERLAEIDRRVSDIDATLARDFSDYAALASPEPLTVEQLQVHLGDREALVLFLDTSEARPIPEETFIWVITKTESRSVRSDEGTKAIQNHVAALRCGLDAAAWNPEAQDGVAGEHHCKALLSTTFKGGRLPFDQIKAHELYEALFGQVGDLIEGKSLLLVPSGALTQLPFQVLITAHAPAHDASSHPKVAWLMRGHAIAVLPSIASLKALRAHAGASRSTKSMIAFANPTLEGNAEDMGNKLRKSMALYRQSCELPQSPEETLTEIAAQFNVALLGADNAVAEVRRLNPIPGTAKIVCEIAREPAFGDASVLLGRAATEARVRALNAAGELAQYRIVHFATHGVTAGQVTGIDEPGLILTPPEVPADKDDNGYLAASEISELKLDADWVVLSACNTATGQSAGGEALSGLARAFFYAGARALLVSHWSVREQAAVGLVTKALADTAADKRLGRAEAMRRAMLALADSNDPAKAHPAYWAPFVVVGEPEALP